MNGQYYDKNRTVTICDGHISGLLGEAILKLFLKEELIKKNDNEFDITEKGWDELEIIGIDTNKLQSIKRRIVSICFESKQGILYEHIGSYLGVLLKDRVFELGWMKKIDDYRYEITDKGLKGFESMGVRIKSL